jgi:ubiquinone/menaquinone biosynthesis C-methylase UbiE
MNEPQFAAAESAYVFGHSANELQRLALQSQYWGEATLEWLVRAGIGRGMRVLDLGSGGGDVALLAASLVGETGSVLGVDRAASSVEAATQRAQLARATNVSFQTSLIESLDVQGPFDAIVGRLVLLYLQDPAATLAAMVRKLLKPGGIVAFMDIDIDGAHTVPPVRAVSDVTSLLIKTFRLAGNDLTMGARLPQVFRAANLPDPQTIARTRIEAAPAIESTRYLAATVASLLPMMEKLGVARTEDMQIDSLAARMQQGLVEANATIVVPLMVGAWTRSPV